MGDLQLHLDADASSRTFARREHEQVYRGVRMWKAWSDLERYAKVIAACRPEVIVETGTRWGGSALWFVDQGDCDVITVDIDGDRSATARALTDRVDWVVGDAIDPETIATVTELVAGRRCMVSLDSEHHAEHVGAEIRAYGPLVTAGCYLVVEDGIFDAAPQVARLGGRHVPKLGGPLTAIRRELAGAAGWVRDEEVERMSPVTHHPAGWWIRG